jgi:predicted MFS family arabinose efflux permease
MVSTTRWPLVFALIFAGVVGAFQIGKAPIAVPLLREDLGLSLTFAAWVVGIYAVVGAVVGLPMGLWIKYFGVRRAIVVGLLMIGLASCAGASARSGTMLLVTRVVEGFGFIMVVIAAPSLLRAVTSSKDRDLVFGLWTVYYSAGTVIVMLAGPWLATMGWQSIWLVTGFIALGYALVIWAVAPDISDADGTAGGALADVGRVLRSPGPVLLALVFGLYTLQYHALTGLLPALLVERLDLSIAQAGAIGAATIVANGIGAFSAAWLLRAGLPLWAMVAAGFTFFGLASFGVFAQGMPAASVALLAAASLGIAGVIPALIYIAAPRLTPEPAMLALSVGAIVQASHIGHLIGPVALGTWVEHFGWPSAPAVFATIALAGVASGVALRGFFRA